MTNPASANSSKLGVVTWGAEPLSFQIHSSKPEALRMAKKVFRFWLTEPSNENQEFQLEQGTDERWQLSWQEQLEEFKDLDQAIMRAEYLAVREYQSAQFGLITLHGALLTRGEQSVAIVGDYKTGKSTLAVELWQRGWTLQSDDLMVVQPGWGGVKPLPRRVCLRESSKEYFPAYVWRQITRSSGCHPTQDGWMFEPREVETRVTRFSGRMSALVILYPQPGRLQAISSSDAAVEMVRYSSLAAEKEQWSGVQKLLPLTEQVKAFRLGRCPLGEQADEIERALPV